MLLICSLNQGSKQMAQTKRMMDFYDRELIRGEITQAAYDRYVSDLNRTTHMRCGMTMFSITFFPSEAAAVWMAEANGGKDEGFVVAPAKGRDGKFVVQVLDTDDGLLLGHL